MAERSRKESKAAQEALEVLLNVLPKSETGIHNIVYTFGLICRETEVPVDKATETIMAWSERLRAIPQFRELYPRYRKPSFYRYQVRYTVLSAYKRAGDKPSSYWFTALTGRKAPAASFWDNLEPIVKKRRTRKTQGE